MQHHNGGGGLQGPRPATLKVVTAGKRRPARQQPVIIYVESPKVVHAHPAEFKSVVQRLTGAAPPSMAPPLQQQFPFQLYGAAALPSSSTTTVGGASCYYYHAGRPGRYISSTSTGATNDDY